MAEVGEPRVKGYKFWCCERWMNPMREWIGGPVEEGKEVAFPAESPVPPNEKLSSPLYQSILAEIDAHDSATRCERADRVYAGAMRMIGGG